MTAIRNFFVRKRGCKIIFMNRIEILKIEIFLLYSYIFRKNVFVDENVME